MSKAAGLGDGRIEGAWLRSVGRGTSSSSRGSIVQRQESGHVVPSQPLCLGTSLLRALRFHRSPASLPRTPAAAVGSWCRIEHKAVIGEDVFVKVGLLLVKALLERGRKVGRCHSMPPQRCLPWNVFPVHGARPAPAPHRSTANNQVSLLSASLRPHPPLPCRTRCS